MAGLTSNDSSMRSRDRFEPQESRADLRQRAIDAVHQCNAQLVGVLCAHAITKSAPFPFSDTLRTRFSSLGPEDRVRLSRCGTLLVDLGFSELPRWRAVVEVEDPSPLPAVTNHWLPSHEAFVLGHSAILVAWSVLHSPADAYVLLGMSEEVAQVFGGMGVDELSQVAQRHPDWVNLRWARQPNAWSNLLDYATDVSLSRSRFTALRCLQLSGGHSGQLGRYLQRTK